jgi:hypothetical protein
LEPKLRHISNTARLTAVFVKTALYLVLALTSKIILANGIACILNDPQQLRKNYGYQNKRLSEKIIPTFYVYQTTALKEAIKNSKNGDVIAVKDGIYDLGKQEINRSITLMAENNWGVMFIGKTVFDIKVSNVKIDGFKFLDGGPETEEGKRHVSIVARSDDITISNNHFENIGINSTSPDKTGITIRATRANRLKIENNVFLRSKSIAIKIDDYCFDLVVSKNSFLDSPGFGGAGEIVHIGDAHSNGPWTSPTKDSLRARVTRNYVRGWTLESELISIKSNDNIISENFIEKSGSSAIVVRMGNNNLINSNIILNNKITPIRISGKNNMVQGNFFSGSDAMLYFHSEMPYANSVKNMSFKYWSADSNELVDNVFIGFDKISATITQHGPITRAPTGNVLVGNFFIGQSIGKLKNNDINLSIGQIQEIPMNVDCSKIDELDAVRIGRYIPELINYKFKK